MNDIASAKRVARSYGVIGKAEVEQFARLLMSSVERSKEQERQARAEMAR